MRRLASALGSLALLTFASAPAFADCIPGTGLCASASAGVAVGIPVLPLPQVQVGGRITIGIPPLFGPAPAVAPAAPVAPAPAPAYPYQPPAPVYVYGPQAPRYGYGYAPAPAIYTPNYGASRLGIDVRVDGFAGAAAGHQAFGLGGAGVGFRYRATPHFGLELGADVLGGRDYNGYRTTSIAGNFGGMLFVNPRSRAQLYLSGGVLVDRSVEHDAPQLTAPGGPAIDATALGDVAHSHVGGYAGLGLEMFATRRLSFHLDMRGVVRQAVGGDVPEFTDTTTGRSTNTSAGLIGSAGMAFYF